MVQTADLPHPGGPTTKIQCLTSRISAIYITFKMKISSGISPISFLVVYATIFFNSKSIFGVYLYYWKRSSINLMKMFLSSVTILGMLKSLKPFISNSSSGILGSALFNLPAYLSTDLTALRPQS